MIAPQLSYERAFEPTDLIEQVELFRLDANRQLDSRRRVELGQFMTPSPIARLMASMLVCYTSEVSLLDAGAGVG
jgi:adenine-specific DNA-methyltransferase